MKSFNIVKNQLVLPIVTMLFFAVGLISVDAQDISYYVDYLGNFQVFENGEIKQVDHLPVTNIVIGGDYLFYQDDFDNLVYYSKGEKEVINSQYPAKLVANRNFAITSMGGGTNVFYNNKLKNLALEREPTLSYSDSLVAFLSHDGYLNIFKDGFKKEIEGPFNRTITRDVLFKISNNTLAYIDLSGTLQLVYNNETTEIDRIETTYYWLGERLEFKDDGLGNKELIDKNSKDTIYNFPASEVFFTDNFIDKDDGNEIVTIYFEDDVMEATVKDSTNFNNIGFNWNGEIILYADNEGAGLFAQTVNFWVGTNLVAYLNEYNEFHIYDNEFSLQLENYPPEKVYASNEFVAYIDDDLEFKIYYRGNVEEIDINTVDIIGIKDDIIVWTDANGYFYYWQDGETTLLENYTPQKVQIDLNHIVYTDYDGRLKGVYDGKKVEYTDEIVEQFDLLGNVLRYQPNRRDIHVYWKGKNY